MAGFIGEYVRLQQSTGDPSTTFYSGWLGPADFQGLMDLLPKEKTYENIKEEEEAREKAKKKGYPKVKAEEEKTDDKFEPERILLPGVVEGYSSFKTALSKIPAEKEVHTKQDGA